jgi:hypothetical protein
MKLLSGHRLRRAPIPRVLKETTAQLPAARFYIQPLLLAERAGYAQSPEFSLKSENHAAGRRLEL